MGLHNIEKNCASGREDDELVEERRRFLANCGKFAAVTPPLVTLLLSTSDKAEGAGGPGGAGGPPFS